MNSIPNDLFLEIFSRLPEKSIGKCRCVSKLWGSMLRRPDFTELFLTRSSARPRLLFALRQYASLGGEWSFFSSPQLQNSHGKSSLVVSARFHMKLPKDMIAYGLPRVLASGLIYFSHMKLSQKISEDTMPMIFNPRTRQYASLPIRGVSTSFLGFDPIGKQFKVLFMFSPYYDDEKEDPRILTLGTGEMSWRKIQRPLLSYDPLGPEICIDGILYYIAIACFDVDDGRYVIVCFDVRSEKFKFMDVEFFCDKLINYKGKLGGIKLNYDGDDNTLEFCLWVLDDVEKQEWSKYTFSTFWDDNFVHRRDVAIAGVTAVGDIVLSMRYWKPYYVFYFNLERNTLQHVEVQGFGEYYNVERDDVFVFVDHVEDLSANDAKFLKSSRGLNIIRKRPKPPKIYDSANNLFQPLSLA